MLRSIKYIMIIFVIVPGVLFGQYFGKNKVQYEYFHWQYLQTEHFDVYFTDGGKSIAEFAGEIAEASYRQLKEDFRYEISKRITLIVHNSHNDFEQTNVDLNPGEESVGGFTEFFKDRVVVPYEGEWEKFRHVIHHELTHAVMLQMVYGAGVQSIITGMARLQIPLWLTEGLAEYESRGWDTESDMFMRDAALNEYVPPVDYLYGYMAYKGGQSVLYYLADKYGGEKIGELLGKIKITKSMSRGLKQSIGVDTKELTEKWHLYLKREYWPDIADRKEPEEIGKRLTDHEKWHNFVNSGPALSPKGDKIAFLSDKSGYFDIYLMSAIDGKIISKLVSGQQTPNLEELHWLRAGLSWSPDSKFVVFAAKAGAQDALHIVNVKKRKIVKELKFDLDGIFTPSWSPTSNEIAFMGVQNGEGDIYVYNLKTKKLRKLTHDVFSDLQPNWSPDGKKIAFVSDRGDMTKMDEIPPDFKIFREDFSQKDIYVIDVASGEITRITDTSGLESSPVFSPDGKKLAYTSDQCGISNIYVHDIETGINYPITNVVTGIFNLSWRGDEKKIAFTSFYKGGYDVYLLRNPLAIKAGDTKLKDTNFITKHPISRRGKKRPLVWDQAPPEKPEVTEQKKYKHFVFDDKFKNAQIKPLEQEKPIFLDSTEYKLKTGDYKVHNYRVKFSPDLIYGNAQYDQFFGLQGMTQIALSDVLGNHRLNIYTNLFYDLRNSNYQVSYFYLPHKTDFGIGAFHYAYYFYIWDYGIGWVRDRNYGANVYISHPFSKFNRLDGALTWISIERDYINVPWLANETRNLLLADLSYTNDTVLWGYTGPVNGNRYAFNVRYSPALGNSGIEFLTLKLDYRKYFKIGKDYNFVFRFSGGASGGKQPQQFFLGGTSGWLNYKTSGGLRVRNLEDIYFSTFELPMRGGYYYERVGNRFFLNNIEFRFPLIRYFLMGWPLGIGFQNIRGALFTDIGGAWYDNNFRGADATGNSRIPALKDIFFGYGIGARMNLGMFVLRFDVAWNSDWANYTHGPYYYFSIGPEF